MVNEIDPDISYMLILTMIVFFSRTFLDNNTVSGLLLNDTSNHLPVFVVYDVNYRNEHGQKQIYKLEQENQLMFSKLTYLLKIGNQCIKKMTEMKLMIYF